MSVTGMDKVESVEQPSQHRTVDRHWLSEFVYGVITAMVVIAALVQEREDTWWQAFLIIVAGSAAVWIAHSYSEIISERLVVRRRLVGSDFAKAMRQSWPIVTAGAIVAVPTLFPAIGLTSVETSLTACNVVGIIILALVGYLAGMVTKEKQSYRFFLAAASAGVGVIVVAIEFIVHHL